MSICVCVCICLCVHVSIYNIRRVGTAQEACSGALGMSQAGFPGGLGESTGRAARGVSSWSLLISSRYLSSATHSYTSIDSATPVMDRKSIFTRVHLFILAEGTGKWGLQCVASSFWEWLLLCLSLTSQEVRPTSAFLAIPLITLEPSWLSVSTGTDQPILWLWAPISLLQ